MNASSTKSPESSLAADLPLKFELPRATKMDVVDEKESPVHFEAVKIESNGNKQMKTVETASTVSQIADTRCVLPNANESLMKTSSVTEKPIVVSSSSPPKLPLPPISAQETLPCTPSRKRDINISSTSKSSALSGGKSEIHNLIATNLALESVFLVTYRIEAAHHPIKYIGSSKNVTDSLDYINHTNVSEIVCTLLSEDTVMGGAIGYLIGSYKRLIDKENAVTDRVKEDLVRYLRSLKIYIESHGIVL